MSSLAQEMQEMAIELIGDFDERKTKVKLIRQGVRFFDPTRGANVFGANTELPADCVKTSQKGTPFENSQIESGDIILVVDGKVKPLLSDNVISDGKTYSIEDIKNPNYTGDEFPIVYFVHARG